MTLWHEILRSDKRIDTNKLHTDININRQQTDTDTHKWHTDTGK